MKGRRKGKDRKRGKEVQGTRNGGSRSERRRLREVQKRREGDGE